MRYFLIILIIVLSAASTFAADRQSQFWTAEKITGKINNQSSFFLQIDHRYSNDNEELAQQHSIIGLGYKVNESITISPFYRTVNYRSGQNWLYEHRPSVDFKIKHTISEISLSARTRIERRIYPGKDNVWRFREQFEVKSGKKLTRLQIQPFIADDIFYQENKDGFYRNWLILGFDVKVLKQLKTRLFYQLQSEEGKDEKWAQTDILAAQFGFDF